MRYCQSVDVSLYQLRTNYGNLLIHCNVHYVLFMLFISSTYLAYHSKISGFPEVEFDDHFQIWLRTCGKVWLSSVL